MEGQEASLVKQVLACFTMYTLSMSIGAGTGFSGVVSPQVCTTWVYLSYIMYLIPVYFIVKI